MSLIPGCLGTFLAASVMSGGVAHAAPKKAPAKATKVPGKARAAEPPAASAEELNKVKGEYKWGMTSEEVVTKMRDRIAESFKDRLEKAANDPTKQDRVRKAMRAEQEAVKDKLVKFDGQKTGWDTSIIDLEFGHKTSESMLSVKEPTADRYFFFRDDRLYKMFLAFDKEILRGKSFEEFGQAMQGRFGKAKEVTVEERAKAGVKIKLDHYMWGSKAGDGLRLVDRSEFYDVYCLVVYDAKVASDLEEARKIANPTVDKRDALVEAVTAGAVNDRDPNDNIVDQITGQKPLRPGEVSNESIVVPSVSGARGPSPAEVNRKGPSEAAAPAAKGKAPAGRSAETRGLQL
jgi:hypothetical protein